MKNNFEAGKFESIAYGISVKNYGGKAEETVAFQELKEIGIADSSIVVDVVRSDSWRRPKLESLIETYEHGDEIIILSIDTLLIGTNNKGIEYYKQILEKGIYLSVLDLSGRIARRSEFSTCYYDSDSNEWKLKTNHEELINNLIEYKSNKGDNFRVRRINKKFSADFYTKDSAFKEIYFAYEAYQIDYDTTIELFRKYCGINNVKTIRNIMSDYEKIVMYERDFFFYSKKHTDILELPKRYGGVPNEYFVMKSAIEEYITEHKSSIEGMTKVEIFNEATAKFYYYTSYEIYHRWELLEMKKPKPRIPIGRTFDIEKFKHMFSPIVVNCN